MSYGVERKLERLFSAPGALPSGFVAGVTGLEPATSGVTGQRSNQLSYTPNEAGTMYLPASLSVKPGVLGYQRVKGLFSNNWP